MVVCCCLFNNLFCGHPGGKLYFIKELELEIMLVLKIPDNRTIIVVY